MMLINPVYALITFISTNNKVQILTSSSFTLQVCKKDALDVGLVANWDHVGIPSHSMLLNQKLK